MAVLSTSPKLMNRFNQKLADLITSHSNNYVFDVNQILIQKPNKMKNLSIVIPYHNSKNTINLLLKHLFVSVEYIKSQHHDWGYQIIIVDDGSLVSPAINYISSAFKKRVEIISLGKNCGRSYARDIGLSNSMNEITLFLDSDILVSQKMLYKHMITQTLNKSGKPIITAGIFHFCHSREYSKYSRYQDSANFTPNDFRINCLYDVSWIGCTSDKKFAGKRFKPISDTNDFRNWPIGKKYGPWLITNMVLGGFFTVDTKSALSVNGMDLSFDKYGFTETPLVTKIIALHDAFVVPIISSFALHIDDRDVSIDKINKDKLFQAAHHKYFKNYLNLSLKEALKK